MIPGLGGETWGHAAVLFFMHTVLFHFSVLDGHGFRIDGFFARDSFEACEYASVIVFVGLKCKAAFFAAIVPSEADEVLLRFGQRHQGSNPQSEDADADGCAHSPVNILAVTDLRDGSGWNHCYIRLAVGDPNVTPLDVKFDIGAGLDAGDRSAVIGDLIAVIASKGAYWKDQAENDCE